MPLHRQHRCVTLFSDFRKRFRAWQVWILIQQNKGMRTEVLNFPTVPVFFRRQQNITRTYGWLEKYPCTLFLVWECLRARGFLFVSFFSCHFCFFNLHYTFWALIESCMIFFSSNSFWLRILHLASSSHINSCGPRDPWENVENFFVP